MKVLNIAFFQFLFLRIDWFHNPRYLGSKFRPKPKIGIAYFVVPFTGLFDNNYKSIGVPKAILLQ